METLKNFLTGIVVIIVSLILLSIIFFTWPIFIGISSLLLSIFVFIFFIVLLFYLVVLIGYILRSFIASFTRKKE